MNDPVPRRQLDASDELCTEADLAIDSTCTRDAIQRRLVHDEPFWELVQPHVVAIEVQDAAMTRVVELHAQGRPGGDMNGEAAVVGHGADAGA